MLSAKQLAFCQVMAFFFSLLIGGVLLYMLLNTPDGTKRPGMYMMIWLYFAAQIGLAIASAALAQALKKSMWLWGALPLVLGSLGGIVAVIGLRRKVG
ncbi:hypothetical protein NT239_00190 [Chitinibacter sp. SCUT-21]|uniref:hypothetical protein n=1 Tax=Chitinibacter sp. SCUT-21 TaxID=2970891 RepID=UPI0035A6E8D0